MRTNKALSLIILPVVLSGCATPPDINERLGQFTAASSFDIRNLSYEKSHQTTTFVEGKACYQVNPYNLMYMEGPTDNLIQRAMDNAIRNGQKNGVDGDLLVNARIEKKTEHRNKSAFVKERFECIFVSGDLVRIKA